MIWYVTSESENTEGLSHLLHNKLYRGSQCCCACFVVSDLDDTVWIVTRLNQWEVLSSVPSGQPEMMRRCFSSRWCLFSPGLLSSVQPQHGGWHSSVTSLVVFDPRNHYMLQTFLGYFSAPAHLIHTLSALGTGLCIGEGRDHGSSTLLLHSWPGCGGVGQGAGSALSPWVSLELFLWRDRVLVAQPCTAGCDCTPALRSCIFWREEFEICDPLSPCVHWEHFQHTAAVLCTNMSCWGVWGDIIWVSLSQHEIWQAFHLERELGTQKYRKQT